jgi:hypothetical protein
VISEFGSLIFGVFELCCLVINEFGNICSWCAFVLWGFAFFLRFCSWDELNPDARPLRMLIHRVLP